MSPLQKIQSLENEMIANACKGTFRHDLFEQMMNATMKLHEIDHQLVFEYRHPEPAKWLDSPQEKTYREFPTDKPDREILANMEAGHEFYIKLFGNYNLALLQAKVIGCAVSYNKKHGVNWTFTTHRVNNELKVTRVG